MKALAVTFALPLAGNAYALEHELPDPRTNPGSTDPAVTQENLAQTVCVPGYTKPVRPPTKYTNALKLKQLKEYGYERRNPKLFEEDHIIPLAVGGHPTDPANLWPQPWEGKWNARVKDKLEQYYHRKLCAGGDLKEAQGAFKGDWIAKFKKMCGDQPTAKCRNNRLGANMSVNGTV
jgi:hypothetical protein